MGRANYPCCLHSCQRAMLQAMRLAGTALKRSFVSLNRPPSLQALAMAFTVLPQHRRQPEVPRVPPAFTISRTITRMRRRIPPAPPKKDENEPSSQSEDDEEVELDFNADDDYDEGVESEELEGFFLDFGADGKEEKNEGSEQE